MQGVGIVIIDIAVFHAHNAVEDRIHDTKDTRYASVIRIQRKERSLFS